MDDLVALRGDVADMREKQGTLTGEIRQIGQSISHLVGIVEGNQRANETAHRAQDDRTAKLHGDVRVALSRIDQNEGRITDHEKRLRDVEGTGIRGAGEIAAQRRWGEWMRLAMSGAVGGLATWLAQALSSGRH